MRTWLQNFPGEMKEETKKYLWGLFASYLDEGFKFVRKQCSQGIDQVWTVSLYITYQLYMLGRGFDHHYMYTYGICMYNSSVPYVCSMYIHMYCKAGFSVTSVRFQVNWRFG